MRTPAVLLLVATILASVPASAELPYTVDDGVQLSPRIESLLTRIATEYRRRSGRTLHVTSGTRTPQAQAEAMFDKLRHGQNLLRLYRDEHAANEIVHAFRVERRRGRPAAVHAMAEVIRGQMQRGCFVSRHLSAGAIDIRSRTMNRSQRRIFANIVGAMPDVELLPEGAPPHFHLQLR